jgi:hypothetical protein
MEDSQNTQPTSTSESCDPTSVKRQLDFSDSAIPSLKTLSLRKKGWFWGFYQPKPNSPDMRSCKLCLTIQDDNPTMLSFITSPDWKQRIVQIQLFHLWWRA